MMSQVELWNMQEYCCRKNRRRERISRCARRTRITCGALGLAFVLGCLCVPIVLAWGL
ncbi:MAG: hypothetical protein MJ144_02480 [Clostridia bacterium]|nr:hypothetical protein [Clostridia bacterium]